MARIVCAKCLKALARSGVSDCGTTFGRIGQELGLVRALCLLPAGFSRCEDSSNAPFRGHLGS
jgi:hypothetical protein